MTWYRKERVNKTLVIAYVYLLMLPITIGEACYSVQCLRVRNMGNEVMLAAWLCITAFFILYVAAMRAWKKWLAVAGVLLICSVFLTVVYHVRTVDQKLVTPAQSHE